MKLLEFNKKFGTEEDCVQYLKERREQDGLVCSKCGGGKASLGQIQPPMDMLRVPSYHHIDIRDGDAWKQSATDVLVHVAISNAKALMKDMYHGIKEEFLQSYLDEFCYKFNRMYFGDRTFDRLVDAEYSPQKKIEFSFSYSRNISYLCIRF